MVVVAETDCTLDSTVPRVVGPMISCAADRYDRAPRRSGGRRLPASRLGRIRHSMDTHASLPLIAPRITPALDPAFVPPCSRCAPSTRSSPPRRSGDGQAGARTSRRLTFRFDTRCRRHARRRQRHASGALRQVPPVVRGGWRLFIDGPPTLVARLAAHYRDTATGRFDASSCASRCSIIPRGRAHTRPAGGRSETRPLGRHLEGCRIGFDLGGDRRWRR